MNNTTRRRSSAAYTPNIHAPSKQGPISKRGLVGLVLAVLLPPVGIYFLWREGVFETRGRMLITAISTLEMVALIVLITPRPELATVSPMPAPPPSVTAAPAGETVKALTNLEQLIYEHDLAQAIARGGSEEDLKTDEERLAEANARNEVIYNTTVYSVYSNAKFFHREPICGNQTNGRSLTTREALREGLGQCPNCKPDLPTG